MVMKNNHVRLRFIIYLVIVYLIAFFVLKTLQVYILTPLITDAYNGESISFLNELIKKHRLKNPDVRTQDFYLQQSNYYIIRIYLLSIFFGGFGVYHVNTGFKRIKSFFQERDHPINLSVLRIIVFTYLLVGGFHQSAITFSKLGKDALVPPFGWGFLLDVPHPSAEVVTFLVYLFWISCVFGLLGIFTLRSIQASTVLGFFIIGLPMMYGKINSYYIIWHILLLMSFGPKNHLLSIDTILKKRKSFPSIDTVDFSKTAIIINSTLILIGFCYLFPGIWKFVFSGFEWALSDNLKYKMHSKWLELGGWLPIIRLDHFPFLYKFSALLTLVLEITFSFGIFFKTWRPIFIIVALGFHIMVAITMKIIFWPVIILYACFIDWSKIIPKKYDQIPQSILFNAKNLRSLMVASFFVLFFTILTGATLIKSWPFGVYPTFASIEKPQQTTLAIEINNSENKPDVLLPILAFELFKEDFESSERLRGFLDSIVLNENTSNMRALTNSLSKHYPNATSYTFYTVLISTNPDTDYQVLQQNKALYNFKISE